MSEVPFELGDRVKVHGNDQLLATVVGIDNLHEKVYFLYEGDSIDSRYYAKSKHKPVTSWGYNLPFVSFHNISWLTKIEENSTMFSRGDRVVHEKLGEGTFWARSVSDSNNAAVSFDMDCTSTYRVPLSSLTPVWKFPFKVGDIVQGKGGMTNTAVVIDIDQEREVFVLYYKRRPSTTYQSIENNVPNSDTGSINHLARVHPFSYAKELQLVPRN